MVVQIDFAKDREGKLLNWGRSAKIRFPQTFTDNYKGAETFIVSLENVEEFLIDG